MTHSTDSSAGNFATDVYLHLERLAVDIGARPSGSPGNRAAAEYLAHVFHACGLEVERQGFACPGWEANSAELEFAGEALPVAANAYSPPCDVSAPLVPVCTMAELERAELRGRIAVLYGELSQAPLAAKSWFLRDEREARLVELLEQKAPAALVTVQNRPGELERLVEDWEFAVPSVTAPVHAARTLLTGPARRARLQIRSRRWQTTTCNIIGRKPGPRGARLVFCAHYDTKIDTPGAGDNGGGVAVLLALAQRLPELPLACGLEFVAFTNEEYLPLGDDEYVRRGEAAFGEILAAVNFDGVGSWAGANTITAMAGAPEFEAAVRRCQGRFPGVAWVEPWPESNHSTFAWRGVPSVACSNTAVRGLAHLRSDTIEWMSRQKLEEIVALGVSLAEELHDRDVAALRQGMG